MRFRRYLAGLSGFLLGLPLGGSAGPIGTNSQPLPHKLHTIGSTIWYDQAGPASAAISADGNTIVLGAPYESSDITNAGAVYVFTRNASGWTQQQKLAASDPGTNHYFGNAVAIEGNTI